jgi:hypothetical protein
MRYLHKSLKVIAGCLLFFSCDPCKNLDCISDNIHGQFRIVDANNGNDLVFGPNRIYKKNQIEFYSFKGADTTFFEWQAIKFQNIGYDSILHIRFYPQVETVYMRLSKEDIDTIKISYNTFNTKCCGTITEIKDFKFNSSANIPGNKGTQEIKK